MWHTLALVLAFVPAVMLADMGHYTDRDGLSCSWNGSGNYINTSCYGVVRTTGQSYSYWCTIYRYSSGSMSWNCRDEHGGTWSGSN